MPVDPGARTFATAALLSALVAAAFHLALGDMHVNLADEGYLWYGVLGVLRGEVPFRDFQSYDPARYYWCAAFTPLLGHGILGLRASVAVFQAIGLTLGLLVARRFVRGDAALIVPALVLSLWMFPRHKLFEPAIALGVTWFVVRLCERPTARRHLAAGACVGLAAFFGRNHGLYAGLAVLAAFGLAVRHRPEPGVLRRFGALTLGVLLGYAPMLAMLAFVPGLRDGFADALRDLLTKGANVPLPWPWPWRTDLAGTTGLHTAARVAVAGGFLLPVLLLPLGLLRVLRARGDDFAREAALVGVTLVALVYVHHVTVRSDEPHLGQCIQPVLLLAFALPTGGRARAASACGLLLFTGLAALECHTTLRWLAPWRGGAQPLHDVDVAGEPLRLLGAQAATVEGLRRDVGARLTAQDEIFVAPSRPTYYPLLGKRSPVRDIYLFWFASVQDQRAIVERLETRRVRWALIVDTAIDDREDLRFSNTHPLVWTFLHERYERVPTSFLREDHLLFRRPAP